MSFSSFLSAIISPHVTGFPHSGPQSVCSPSREGVLTPHRGGQDESGRHTTSNSRLNRNTSNLHVHPGGLQNHLSKYATCPTRWPIFRSSARHLLERYSRSILHRHASKLP